MSKATHFNRSATAAPEAAYSKGITLHAACGATGAKGMVSVVWVTSDEAQVTCKRCQARLAKKAQLAAEAEAGMQVLEEAAQAAEAERAAQAAPAVEEAPAPAATTTVAQRIREAGISRPLVWNEMGSSERDEWEERQLARLDRAAARAAARQQAQQQQAAEQEAAWEAAAPTPTRSEIEATWAARREEHRARTFGRSYPALNGAVVMQGHANWCAEHGHAVHTIDGEAQAFCPRCGELHDQATVAAASTPAAPCRSVEGRIDFGPAGRESVELTATTLLDAIQQMVAFGVKYQTAASVYMVEVDAEGMEVGRFETLPIEPGDGLRAVRVIYAGGTTD